MQPVCGFAVASHPSHLRGMSPGQRAGQRLAGACCALASQLGRREQVPGGIFNS